MTGDNSHLDVCAMEVLNAEARAACEAGHDRPTSKDEL